MGGVGFLGQFLQEMTNGVLAVPPKIGQEGELVVKLFIERKAEDFRHFLELLAGNRAIGTTSVTPKGVFDALDVTRVSEVEVFEFFVEGLFGRKQIEFGDLIINRPEVLAHCNE